MMRKRSKTIRPSPSGSRRASRRCAAPTCPSPPRGPPPCARCELHIVRGQTLGLALFGHKLHGRTLQVTDDRVVAVAFAKRLLIDTDVGDRTRLLAGTAAGTARCMMPKLIVAAWALV
jgi:hypothetical protein